jgi:hypothetical protein
VHSCVQITGDTLPVEAGAQMMKMRKCFNMYTVPVTGVENFYEEDGPNYKTLLQHNSPS